MPQTTDVEPLITEIAQEEPLMNAWIDDPGPYVVLSDDGSEAGAADVALDV